MAGKSKTGKYIIDYILIHILYFETFTLLCNDELTVKKLKRNVYILTNSVAVSLKK